MRRTGQFGTMNFRSLVWTFFLLVVDWMWQGRRDQGTPALGPPDLETPPERPS